MDVKSVSTSSLLSRSPENGTHASVGTSLANNSKRQSPEIPAASVASAPITTSSDSGKSDVRRVEQSGKAEQQHQLQREQLEKVVARIEEFVGTTFNKGLAFRIDEESGKNVVTIYDKRTGEVVRQIPDEEMLSLSRKLAHHSGGLVMTKV
ncbi:flagellar protein FlaG [Photobacterium sp. MCCC 1A19761]|uniref:flagellar protein FlaG n=1 Tax=Photobacterium sp. MCCC 1A19761 TaxID=3115000 RepID=UPI00307FB98F